MTIAKHKFTIVWVSLVILFCAVAFQGQSGRRKGPPVSPPPVPTPTPEPTPVKNDTEKEPEIIFLVGAERDGTFAPFSYTFYDAVIAGCAGKLRRSSSARADVTNADLGRGEAIKKAKADSRTYVVHLHLSGRPMTNSDPAYDYNQIEITFTVFAPTTGKVVTSGRSYPNANRRGPLVVSPTGGVGNNQIYAEALLKRAGEDAGERILKAMHLSP